MEIFLFGFRLIWDGGGGGEGDGLGFFWGEGGEGGRGVFVSCLNLYIPKPITPKVNNGLF